MLIIRDFTYEVAAWAAQIDLRMTFWSLIKSSVQIRRTFWHLSRLSVQIRLTFWPLIRPSGADQAGFLALEQASEADPIDFSGPRTSPWSCQPDEIDFLDHNEPFCADQTCPQVLSCRHLPWPSKQAQRAGQIHSSCRSTVLCDSDRRRAKGQ